MTPAEILDRVLEEHGESWSAEDRELVAQVIRDTAAVAAGMINGGPDHDIEIAQLRAQALSISAAATVRAESVFRATIQRVIGSALDVLVRGIFPPAAPAG